MSKDNMLSDFFVHIPYTIVGIGRRKEIVQLVKERGAASVAIITDSQIVKAGLVETVKSCLEKEGYPYAIYDDCQVHAPSRNVENCSEFVRVGNYDLLIGIGGGSVMDTVKAVSVISPNGMSFADLLNGREIKKILPKILIPTTAGTGSEWSRIGVYYNEDKDQEELVVSNYLFADAVVLDPELTFDMPQRLSVISAMDALTHAIEAYTSATTNVISDALAESAIRLISTNSRLLYSEGSKQIESRYGLSIGASMAMSAVAMSGAGLAHFLNAQIGKRTHIPHGQACILLLPYTMEFNLSASPARFARIANLMGIKTEGLPISEAAQTAVAEVRRMAEDMGIPRGLGKVGIRESDIRPMAEAAWIDFQGLIEMKIPRRVTLEDLIAIYASAL